MSGGNIMYFTAVYFVETHLSHLMHKPYYVVLVDGSNKKNVLSNIINAVGTFSGINITFPCFS